MQFNRINIHRHITEEHDERTVENYYHAGVRPHCRKFVELQKAKAVSHAAWSCAKCMRSCPSGISTAALRCSRLPWNYMCTMLFSNSRTAQMLLLEWLGMPTEQHPSRVHECVYAGSNLACKISRNITPTSISAGTKPNNMQRRKINAGTTFGRGTFPFKVFHIVEHVKARAPLEISLPPLGRRASPVKNHWSSGLQDA